MAGFKDWANPLVRPHIRPYVEVSSTVSEFYQAERLQNTDVDLLQLMWADFKNAPGQYFYIKELARLRDGRFVIPMKWLCVIDNETRAETDCADVYVVEYETATGIAHLHADQVIRIQATELIDNVLDLKNQGLKICFDDTAPQWTKHMPHPVRLKAQGRPTFTVGLMSWADDVSGNRSKQYNAHTNVYAANLNLPHCKLQQEYFVRFSSTSPTATALEQLDGFLEDIGPDRWHEAYDCLLKQEILFRLILRVDPADNPQQSELCSHIGLNGNKFCLLDQQLIQKARDLHHKHISSADTQDSRLKNRKLKGEACQAVKNEIAGKIEEELMRWLTEQPAHRYSKIPEDSPLRTQIRPGDHYNKLLVLEGES
ncbi:hypothetical protein BC835DRAFT_1424859 [Cytidiella melzeri]|nr:hypothetical protein BC835DRAFT_1424859 [Cytidiella melzeri]